MCARSFNDTRNPVRPKDSAIDHAILTLSPSDAAFVDKFMDQWTEYLHTIQAQTAASDPKAGLANSLKYDSLGKRLDPSLLNELNDQQLGQLYVLREEAKRVGSLKEIKTPGEI